MNFDLKFTSGFLRSLKSLSKKYRSLKTDLEKFAKDIQKNPFQGDELYPGIRKIRMQITSKGKGKSGGARVITYTVIIDEADGVVHFIEIYDKSEFSTVDVGMIKKIIEDLNLETRL